MRFIFFLCFLPIFAEAQFAPAAGKQGTTAIFMDSSIIKSWATNAFIQCGPKDISQPDSGLVSNGLSFDVIGKADNKTVSLGDGGFAILKFNPPITNGLGYDFAVFENSFMDNFLELAFVEVSSDSIHFFRFNAISLTPESPQISTFGTVEPEKINNLAGKYRGGFGTPFEIEELADNIYLNKDTIRYVKIIDVIGSINTTFASYDSEGHIINEPWPTLFESSGFDLDAVGIIHQLTNNIDENFSENQLKIFPIPAKNQIFIESDKQIIEFSISDILGKTIFQTQKIMNNSIDISALESGLFFLKIRTSIHNYVMRLVKE